jgi:nucleoside-diphosphate-sugar epimerase
VSSIRPTHLLHLAWHAVPGQYRTAAENLAWVGASLALLREFAEQGGRRVVMAGTCAEYDWAHGYCSERVTPQNPATLYGASKHALRLLLDAFGAQSALSSAWGRVFFLYGPHEHPERLVASVARAVLTGQPARCSHGAQIRDYLHVADVAGAFLALLESDVRGPVNIASGQPVAVRDLVLALARRAGREDLVRLGAIEARADEPPLLVGDPTRLRAEVSWRPRYALEAGLEDTLVWWRRELGR